MSLVTSLEIWKTACNNEGNVCLLAKKKKKKKKQLEISILNHKRENEKHKALRYTEKKRKNIQV